MSKAAKLKFEYDIEDRAKIKIAQDIEGIITAIMIGTGHSIVYQLSWIHEGEVRAGWFMAAELEAA